ncbi:hypothetical protein D1AOALGA4SA_4022 [Olavius algarvensis Delta 1 endosymbiont]|nr:hypothetical protein D1AOALGA4SA_4022 [Olavius algarvensis Delta 1 endosymbiont]
MNSIQIYWRQIEGFRGCGIKDKINKFKEIEFLQFLNS